MFRQNLLYSARGSSQILLGKLSAAARELSAFESEGAIGLLDLFLPDKHRSLPRSAFKLIRVKHADGVDGIHV